MRERDLEDAFERIELPLVPVLARMEDRGVAMDPGVLRSLAERFGAESDELVARVHDMAGEKFNLNSTRALGAVLYDKLDLPVLEKTAGGAPSTARRALERLTDQHPIIELIKQYRELSTLLRSYLGPLPELADADGRIHPALFADRIGDRAGGHPQPESPGNPGAVAARARNPSRFRCRAGAGVAVGRLFADRSAGAGPHFRR